MMNIQKQPNRWSCLPVSLSMLTGITFIDLIEEIGHDGSQIIFPDLPEPTRRRAFHLQECSLALLKFDYCLQIIDAEYWYGPSQENSIREYNDLLDLLTEYNGLILGQFRKKNYGHAMAWDCGTRKIYDPNGTIYPLTNDLKIFSFGVVNQIRN